MLKGQVNTEAINDRSVKLSRPKGRERFLRGLGINVGEEVVQAVIASCSGASGLSLYQLYTWQKDSFQAAKPTIYKIKRLYDSDELRDYVKYLRSQSGEPAEPCPPVSEIWGPLGREDVPLVQMTIR